jgi:hypothetical protein
LEELGVNPEEVEPLIGRLLIYASHLMRHLTWRGARVHGGGTVPGWYAPEDFVDDAIAKALDGTRVRDHMYYPTVELFLQSIIKSDIGHLARSADNAHGRWLSPPPSENGTDSDAYAIASTDPKPLEVMINRADLTTYRNAVLAQLDGDPLLIAIFHSYEAEVTEPSEIAARLGRSVTEINNAKKRLRRKLETIDAERRTAREYDGGTTRE